MKSKSLISFIAPVLALVLIGRWFFQSEEPFGMTNYLLMGLSIFMIMVGIYFKIQSNKNQQLGLKPTDEFSKRVKERSTSNAFYISFYLWLFIILFVEGIEPRTKIIMAFGLLGMALIFFLNWLYYSKVGISDENED